MMNMIRKYGLLAAGIGLVLVALAANLVTSPASARVRPDGTNDQSKSGTPVPGWGNMMGGDNGMMGGTRDMSGMVGSRDMGGAGNSSGVGTMAGMGSMMGDVDRHFIERMIPHHQAAIDMADLALQKAQRPEIKTLAAHIKRVQTAEIAQMRAWYKQWYGTDVPTTNTGNNRDMMGNMNMGGMMGGSVEDLAKARDFDKAFIEAMIPHHQMALMMSNMALAHGEKADLNNLARSIITNQSAEVQQMRTWYKQWYNSAP